MNSSQSVKNWFNVFRLLIVMIIISSQFGWTVVRSSATPVTCCVDAGPLAVKPTISGNAGIGEAIITYNGGSTIADSLGNYSITVNFGWAGVVTPSLAGYTFSPAYRIYANPVMDDQSHQDYVATLITDHSIYLPLVIR